MKHPPPSQQCIKCGGHMEFGLLMDSQNERWWFDFFNPERILEWVRGEPTQGLFSWEFRAIGKNRLQVATLRCTHCAYVELYAPEPQSGMGR